MTFVHSYFTFLLLLCFSGVNSLYEDQAGKFDWVKRYVGSVDHAAFDESSNPSRRIIVSTRQNIIAALGIKSGDIIWRHVLETPDKTNKISAMHLRGHFVSIVFGNLIRTWDVITAALREEIVLNKPFKRSEASTNVVSFSKTGEEVYFVEISLGTVGFSSFDTISGGNIVTKSFPAPWAKESTKCCITGHVLVCLDVVEKLFYFMDLTSQKNLKNFASQSLSPLNFSDGILQDGAGNPSILSLSKVVGSDLHLIVKVGENKKLIHVHKLGFHLVSDVSDFRAVTIVSDVLFSVIQTVNTLTVQAKDLSTGMELMEQSMNFELPPHSGTVESINVHRFTRKDGGIGIRAFIRCSDHSVHLVSNAGVVWSREEALARILTVESVDLPVSGMEETYHLPSDEAGMLTSFLFRIRSQVHHLIDWLQSLVKISEEVDSSRITLVRDRFNMHKLMVVVTFSGKVLALDTRTSEVIWSVFLPFLSPFANGNVLLFTQRTSAHYPNSPQCIAVGRHKVTGNGLLYVFNPLTGEGVGEGNGIMHLPYSLLHVSLLYHMDENYIKPILLIDEGMKPQVFPRSGELIILQHSRSIFVHLAFPETSSLKGFSFKDSVRGNLQLSEIWSCSVKSNGALIGVFGKKMSENVHSQGRVLADRSVLYKYSNPNLVVVATFGQDELSKNTLTIHLVDTVTGSILETVIHKRVFGPFHVVHSENWIVYTYYNEKSRRHEVTVLELFEGLTQSNVSAFSSFGDKTAFPIVEKQAFILPQGVQSTGHTTTEKGITTKFILFALDTGNVLQVSKWFLDPRRPLNKAIASEEGLVPYMPELPLPPQEMINHNHTLPRVSAIYTAPTGLESTCLVFIYGLDVFYTRVFPSKMFDVLKDDFDHYLIIGALLSLTVAALVTRKLSQRKALKQAWK